MAKKNSAQVKTDVTDVTKGWGAEVIHSKLPSGVKLKLTPDADMLLRFIGHEDITDKLSEKDRRPGKQAIIHKFFDGKRYVSMSMVYATEQAKFEKGYYYYIHHDSDIEVSSGLQPMKDLLILKLGVSGEEIQCPERIADAKTLLLADPVIAEINYTRLNYPLRKS